MACGVNWGCSRRLGSGCVNISNEAQLDRVNIYVNIWSVREIVFLSNGIGKLSSRRVLDTLSSKQAQKVTWVTQLVEELEIVPVKYFKKMTGTDDLWEIRVQSGNNIFRILGFLEEEYLVVLNHAFQKKTQKTPKKEIAVAEARKKDHILRGSRYE
jgi:phage-related protein